jgi:hypothetical protein
MKSMTSPPLVDPHRRAILTSKQASAITELEDALARLDTAESDGRAHEAFKCVLARGSFVYQLEQSTLRKLTQFDVQIRERHPLPAPPFPADLRSLESQAPLADDEIWIENLHRAEVLRDALNAAAARITVTSPDWSR